MARISATGHSIGKFTRLKARKFLFYRVIDKLLVTPEIRTAFRKLLFRYWAMLPKEFLVSLGETVVISGCPTPLPVDRLSKAVGKEGTVVVIEPDEVNFQKHVRHIELQKIQNVILVQKAISNKQGRAEFLVAKSDYFDGGSHHLKVDDIDHDCDYVAEDLYVNTIEVEIDTLDNIFFQLNLVHVDFIEIATNGAELQAFEGIQSSLVFIDRLFIKAHARNKVTGKTHADVLIPALKEKGFKTLRTIHTPHTAKLIDWGERTGDVYAWR